MIKGFVVLGWARRFTSVFIIVHVHFLISDLRMVGGGSAEISDHFGRVIKPSVSTKIIIVRIGIASKVCH